MGRGTRALPGYGLSTGTTVINSDISEDGEAHWHPGLLEDYIPKILPYDVLYLAIRITKDGNMPQFRFNEDGEWHDFAPEGGTGLKSGPWFPFLALYPGDHPIHLCVDRPMQATEHKQRQQRREQQRQRLFSRGHR